MKILGRAITPFVNKLFLDFCMEKLFKFIILLNSTILEVQRQTH